jgi:hypothetical protein
VRLQAVWLASSPGERVYRVVDRIVRFYTLKAPSRVRDRYPGLFSWSLLAPIRQKYGSLAVWVVGKSPEGYSIENSPTIFMPFDVPRGMGN